MPDSVWDPPNSSWVYVAILYLKMDVYGALSLEESTYRFPNHQNGVRGKLVSMRLAKWSNDAALAYTVVVY